MNDEESLEMLLGSAMDGALSPHDAPAAATILDGSSGDTMSLEPAGFEASSGAVVIDVDSADADVAVGEPEPEQPEQDVPLASPTLLADGDDDSVPDLTSGSDNDGPVVYEPSQPEQTEGDRMAALNQELDSIEEELDNMIVVANGWLLSLQGSPWTAALAREMEQWTTNAAEFSSHVANVKRVNAPEVTDYEMFLNQARISVQTLGESWLRYRDHMQCMASTAD